MNSIISGIQKLTEHYALSYINTGDRVLDSTINVMIISVIAYLFTLDYKGLLYGNNKKKEGEEEKEELQFPKDYREINENYVKNRRSYCHYTWKSSEFPSFTKGVQTEYRYVYTGGTQFVNVANMTCRIPDGDIDVSDARVIYQCKDKSFIFIAPHGNSGFHLECSSFDNFTEYRNYIVSKYKNSLETRASIEGSTITSKDKHLGYIYTDRTFDTLVSRHKTMIKKYLDEFMKPNKTAFDLHNLGILFHGPPGTGKTSMIKAIANYTGRQVTIIDLKKTKSIRSLTEEMKHSNRLYCFEELDLIPGILARESQERKDAETLSQNLQGKERDMLYARYTELLKMPEKDTKREIADIKERLEEMKDEIGLDTLLTLLDGPIEQRERLVIATTNYPERIDKALRRPGRFDVDIRLGEYNSDEIKEYLEMFYSSKGASKEDISYIHQHVYPNDIHTPVHVTNICRYYSSARDAVDKLKI